MEAYAVLVSNVGRFLGIDATLAASVIAALLASLMVWLGHYVSHSNAKTSASLQISERVAAVDVREITQATIGGDRWLRFEVRNLGATCARDVVVHASGHIYRTGFDAGHVSVLGPSETMPLKIKLPASVAGAAESIIVLRYRDYRGRLHKGARALYFDDAAGHPRQRGVRM